MNPSFPGTVVDTEIESEYRGTVYERTVYVEIPDKRLRLFDGKSQVTEDDINTDIDFIILGQVGELSNSGRSVEPSIEQPTDEENKQSKWHCTLIGEVHSVDLDCDGPGRLLLDVGQGTVLVGIDSEMEKKLTRESITRGSIIEIDCGRLDIIGRNE